MPDPRYAPCNHAREEVITDADTGARLVVDRPGVPDYDSDRWRPLDREADLLLTRRKVDDLAGKLALAMTSGREDDASVVADQLRLARDHLNDLRADPKHPLLGRDMVGGVAGERNAEAA